jgi:outer membrane protein assembly factor BamB
MHRTVVLLAAAGSLVGSCFLLPTEPTPEAAFGSDLVWATNDEAGTWIVDPVLDGDRVYYVRTPRFGVSEQIESSRIVALGTAEGEEKWSTNVGGARNIVVTSSFVASAGMALEVLDRATGTLVTSLPRGSEAYGSRIATDGSHFYALTDTGGHVMRYDPAAKSVAWDTPVGGVPGNTGAIAPVVQGDRVIALFRRGAPADSTILVALDRATGAILWRFTMGGSFSSTPPVVLDDRVFFVTLTHDVVALSLTTGAKLWQSDARDGFANMVMDGLAACGSRVVVPTGTGKIRAFNVADGALLWDSEKLSLGSNMSLQCSDGTVLAYIGDLHILRATDGTKLATYPRRRNTAFISGVARDASYMYIAAGYALVKIKAPQP